MRPKAADFKRLLTLLSEHRVEFIVVGGVAAVVHGAPITTFDLDVVPSLAPDNIVALEAALRALDAVFRGHPDLRPEYTHLVSRGHKLLLTDAGPLDILGTIGEGEDYERLIAQTTLVPVWGHKLRVLNLDALIRIKERLGRDKDRAVLAVLRRTQAELDKRE